MKRKQLRMENGCRKCALLPALAVVIVCALSLYGLRLSRVDVAALWNGRRSAASAVAAAAFRNASTSAADCVCAETATGVRHRLCYALNATVRGERFSCHSVETLRRLGLLNTERGDESEALQISNPPILSAASGDHYGELRMMIRSAQDTLPNASIVVYDLGLGGDDLKELRAFCHVTVRPFNFSAYPPSVRSLYTYRWKPIIMASSLSEFPHGFWWADSSVRWKSNRLDYLYESVAQSARSPFVLGEHTGHSVYAATNPLMHKYLPSDVSELSRVEMHCACLMFIVRSRISVDVLKWLTLCALESDCMSPPDSALHCSFAADRYGAYARCHRYDQSAANVILANTFAYSTAAYTAGEQRFATVERGHVKGDPPAKCPRSF